MSDTALDYLVGSPVRVETLRAFRADGILSARELDDRLSASRRTLKRTLREMCSRGWIREVDDAYELTSLGGMLLSAYEEFRDRECTAERLRPVFEQTPAAAVDLDVEAAADATVVDTDDDPTDPIDHLLDLRANATELRECAPYLLYDSVEQLAERVTDESSPPDVTLVLGTTSPPMERFPAGYREHFDAMVDAPSVDVYAHPDDIRFSFGIADDHAFVVGVNLDGVAHTLLESDDPAVVDWATRRFETYRVAAAPRS
ncbi:helix-turn-helix transcriptional regulator [Haloplanus salilacus]|uniref:helix-turn-helix transcriptional regulator n=1 Tax=Haloplanus salilacus TaxID=2949994 RepID=UPI0030D313C3